jgi:hypothetical protein
MPRFKNGTGKYFRNRSRQVESQIRSWKRFIGKRLQTSKIVRGGRRAAEKSPAKMIKNQDKTKAQHSGSLGAFLTKCIELKASSLSPKTIRGYSDSIKRMPDSILTRPIGTLSPRTIDALFYNWRGAVRRWRKVDRVPTRIALHALASLLNVDPGEALLLHAQTKVEYEEGDFQAGMVLPPKRVSEELLELRARVANLEELFRTRIDNQ